MRDQFFGPPSEWPSQDLIAFSEDLDPWIAVAAYRCGVFPMPLSGTDFGPEMGWWSPTQRGILPLHGVRVTKSLRRSVRRYHTTVDTCFEQILAQCASPDRQGGWIDEAVSAVYLQLHKDGVAHSVETWDAEQRLVGGLYGVSIGGMFAGESMFHDPTLGRDASKVALLRLVNLLIDGGCELLDVQWVTPHLETLGAVSIDRDEYLKLLDEALDLPQLVWPTGGARLSGANLAATL